MNEKLVDIKASSGITSGEFSKNCKSGTKAIP
jgi:hypothetical protein